MAERNVALLRRLLRSADRLSERAIARELFSVKTPRSRSSALLSRVTRWDQRVGLGMVARLHELEPIPEGIGQVDPIVSCERVLDDVDTRVARTPHHGAKVAHEERGMRLPRGTEIGLHAQV